MELTAEQFREQMRQLLPHGPAWPRSEDSVLLQLLLAWGDEFARVEARIQDLIRESDPIQTTELLGDWERNLGLPDPCLDEPPETLQERRAEVAWTLTLEGGVTPAFLVALAERLGFQVQITENLNPTNLFRVDESRVDEPLNGHEVRFVFEVHAPGTTLRFFRVEESTVEERLETFGNELLECAINRVKPAHFDVKFVYDL